MFVAAAGTVKIDAVPPQTTTEPAVVLVVLGSGMRSKNGVAVGMRIGAAGASAKPARWYGLMPSVSASAGRSAGAVCPL